MFRRFNSLLLMAAGLCWLAFAAVFCLLILLYLADGAGLQFFSFLLPVSSVTVALGLVHVIGFAAALCMAFVIGAGLCIHGIAGLMKCGLEKN